MAYEHAVALADCIEEQHRNWQDLLYQQAEFLGSGTTALVADRLQRHAIGIDLSLTYAEMAQRRIELDCPLFTSWAPAEPPEDERMRDLFAEAAE